MGLLNRIVKKFKQTDNSSSTFTELLQADERPENMQTWETIMLAPSFHTVEDETFGDNDSRYRISFLVNDAFQEVKSHDGEAEMLSIYAPDNGHGEEGDLPCLAIVFDDPVYTAVEEFKTNGTFEGAIEITKLSGKFHFKAKMEYYGDMMYFYAIDRCDGYWENNGLCMIYPKTYAGTENEIKLMKALDEAAESYHEEREA